MSYPLQAGNVCVANLITLVLDKISGYPTYGAANLQMLGQRQVFAVIDALHARGYEVVLTSGPEKTIWPASMKLRRDARRHQ